ncbi:MAG TPA: 3-oxoacyl-[acyl-carrier-protein] synthase III C-terminal domain-containing protein [Longimicrobiales bacterium]|nr:3-oxoacyl-[acyl-carrier-protein] synthase III C-terminal domain-containing protein [Longimicrobiales bacterium]
MIGLTGIGYSLPRTSSSVQQLAGDGLLQSDPALLESFGFDRVFTARSETPYGLACRAALDVLRQTGTEPQDIQLLVYTGPHGPTAFVTAPDAELSAASLRSIRRFELPAARLQHHLGLNRAAVVGIDQGACTNLFAAIRVARSLCLTEGIDRALCVSSEFVPADAGREAIFNCTSDAAVAVLVERGAAQNVIRGSVHVTQGRYWNAAARRNEMIASYFPVARRVVEQAATRAGWRLDEIDWVLPHNISRRSWEVLMGLLELPEERLWHHNIGRVGHTLAGDNFINLADALAAGAVTPGQKLLLFSWGYGAHWTALAVEA